MKLNFFTICFLLIGTQSKTYAQINWQTTNGPEGGTSWTIYDDGQYAFVADEFQFFRSNNGLNWENLPHANIWPLATSPTKLAAGKGYGYNYVPNTEPKFVVSYDHGSTWIEGTLPPTTNKNFSSIAVCSHGIYVPDASKGNMYRTQDDGLTWDTIPAPGIYCYDVWAFEDRLYTEWNGKFWRLALNGNNWELVSPAMGNSDWPVSIFVSDSLLFFVTQSNLWCSSNAGNTWTKTSIQSYYTGDNFCKVGNRVYLVAGQTGIIYTDDFGHTWHELPIPENFNTFELATAGGQLLCGTYNKGVLRYDVPNQRLVTANEGHNSAAVYDLAAGNAQLWAACGNGVFAYDLTQKTWVDKALLPLPQYFYDMVAVSPAGKILAHEKYTKQLLLSVDKGASWKMISPADPMSLFYTNIIKIYWIGENILIQSDNENDAWSTNLGQSWEIGKMPGNIVFFDGRYFGLRWPDGLVSSNDLGQSWNLEPVPNSENIAVLYTTDDKLFALSKDNIGRTQIHSTSDMITWTYSSSGLPQIKIIYPIDDPYIGGIWHKGNRYYLHQNSIGFFTSLDTCKTWLPVERESYVTLIANDSTFFRGGFGGGVAQTGLPQNYGANSTGFVFKDDNNNSIWDANEPALPNLPVSVTEPGAWFPYWFVYTESDGHYSIGSSIGSVDTLQVKVPSPYVQNINPPQHIITNTGNDRNFGVHFKPDITDVSIVGYYAGQPRPGFPLDAYIVYRNEGTVAASGKIAIKLDPGYQYFSAVPAPSAIIGGDSLIWDFNTTSLFDQQEIKISGLVNVNVMIGSNFKMNGHIEPILSDFEPSNNHFMRSDLVVGAYDPNEKSVEPARGLTQAEIEAGKELLYTVQFQNTGNYQADRVRITDLLDTALNVNTLRLVATSHAISKFNLHPGNLLEIVFDPIALPDSNSNEPASHGFVSFAIQRNRAFNKLYKIRNWAAIYFDFNEPVITNTVVTPLFTPTVSSNEPNSSDTKNSGLMISPNPATKDIVVDTRGSLLGAGKIELNNAEGRICLSMQVTDLSNPVNLSINGLIDGVYIVRASNKTGVMFGKLIIARL